ncbi:MAG: hypothetical protein Fur0037_21150 [Planctomycetota bacterium]
MSSAPKLLILIALPSAIAAARAQGGGYPERDILSPFRNPSEIYAPPDAVYEQLRVMRGIAADPRMEKYFDENGVEVVDDPRWKAAREKLAALGIDAGYLAQIMRTSRNADDRDLAFYGAFFCDNPSYVLNLIAHIPGEPVRATRRSALPRAVAYLSAHLRRKWGDLTEEQKKALNLPAVGSPAANAAGLKRAPSDQEHLYSLNLKPFLQLLDLDDPEDQALGLWFVKECSLLQIDLAKAWLEPVLPRLRALLRSEDSRVREQARGLFAAIGPKDLGEAPKTDGPELDAWAKKASDRLFPPIRAISEGLVELHPGPEREAIAKAGRQALLGGSIGEPISVRGDDGRWIRGFRVARVPEGLEALRIPAGSVVISVNGCPVADGKELLALVEKILAPGGDRSRRPAGRRFSIVVEFARNGRTMAVEYRIL